MDFWLVNLVYPLIGAIVGLTIGSLILTPILGKLYGLSVKESFVVLLGK